jgi:hypothetical protein
MRHEVSGTATPHDAVAADPSVPRDVLVYRRVGDPSSPSAVPVRTGSSGRLEQRHAPGVGLDRSERERLQAQRRSLVDPTRPVAPVLRRGPEVDRTPVHRDAANVGSVVGGSSERVVAGGKAIRHSQDGAADKSNSWSVSWPSMRATATRGGSGGRSGGMATGRRWRRSRQRPLNGSSRRSPRNERGLP